MSTNKEAFGNNERDLATDKISDNWNNRPE